MTLGVSLLTKKAVVLAKAQSGIGVPATLSASLDAIQAEEPNFSIDPTVLERNFTSNDLSPFEHVIGRKMAQVTFTTEVRGNGKQQSGQLSDAPRLARLFSACGYELLAMAGDADDHVSTVVPDSKNSAAAPAVDWVISGTVGAAITKPVLYRLTVGAAGALSITNNNGAIDNLAGAASTIASGVPMTLSTASGVSLTPTFTGSIPAGTVYHVLLLPKGLKLKPISSDVSLLTIDLFFDGLKHRVTDAMGTFTVTATAGDYAKIEFTFTGSYNPTTDAALPDAEFETTIPQQVELANLTWGAVNELVVQEFSFDQQNTVTTRPDVNAADGYKGSRITARAPSGQMNPEATLEADMPFWDDFAKAKSKHFVMQVGTSVGNQVVFHGPVVQTSEIGYGDRDGIRNYDVGMLFKRHKGDDEFFIYLC